MKTKSKNHDLPRSGWSLTDVFDMNYIDPLYIRQAICDLCGRELRYVYELSHESHEDIIAGSVCAMKLCDDDCDTIEGLQRFLSSKDWRKSAKGNPWRPWQDCKVTIFPKEDGYGYCIYADDEATYSPYADVYETVHEAKLNAFAALQDDE